MLVTIARHPDPLAKLALLAIVGQVILAATGWILPAVSEYHVFSDTISELVLGRYGLFQTMAFAIAGISTLGLALAIRALTTGSWGSRVGTLLVAAWGVGVLLTALFPTDRIDRPADVWLQSFSGTVHVVSR